MVKTLLTKKLIGQCDFTGEFYQHFGKNTNLTQNLSGQGIRNTFTFILQIATIRMIIKTRQQHFKLTKLQLSVSEEK
jgi:hypothetical protein